MYICWYIDVFIYLCKLSVVQKFSIIENVLDLSFVLCSLTCRVQMAQKPFYAAVFKC